MGLSFLGENNEVVMLADRTKVIALIPARGGSKGVPRKNLRNVNGYPLIAYSIKAALSSTIVDHVWVSTDDREINKTAKKLGAMVLERPDYLAKDSSSAVEVVEHFKDILSESLSEQDAMLVYLQPTSPMRNAQHIDAALLAMEHANVTNLVSVVKCKSSPYKAFKLNEDDMLQSLFGEQSSNSNRQDLPQCYHPNGAIYAFMLKDFTKRGGFPSDGAFPFLMTDRDSVDIDSENDLDAVKKIMERLDDEF